MYGGARAGGGNGIGGPMEDSGVVRKQPETATIVPSKSSSKDNVFGGTTHENVRNSLKEIIDIKNEKKDAVVDEIKKLNKTVIAVNAAGAGQKQPMIVPITSQPEGSVENGAGGVSQHLGDPTIDAQIDKLFSQIGNMLPLLNIAHTNLGISTI